MGEGTLKPAALKLALDLVKDHLGEMPHVVATSLVNDGKQSLQEIGRSTVRSGAPCCKHARSGKRFSPQAVSTVAAGGGRGPLHACKK